MIKFNEPNKLEYYTNSAYTIIIAFHSKLDRVFSVILPIFFTWNAHFKLNLYLCY